MSSEATALIKANTRHNLGVFSVPPFLHDGDPYDKRLRLSNRNGFSTHRNTEWWRENVRKERMAHVPKAPMPTVASTSLQYGQPIWHGTPHFAPLPHFAPHLHPPMQQQPSPHLMLPTGTMPWHVPAMPPQAHPQAVVLFYLPCWVPVPTVPQ